MPHNSHDNLVIMRHLKDKDALRTHGFDSPILPGQEDVVSCAAQEIRTLMQKRGVKHVDIFSSPAERCVHTTRLLRQELAPHLTVYTYQDARIGGIDKGGIVVPPSYRDGESFTPLREAYEALWEQLFTKHEYTYRFGDPLCEGGTCTYPHLNKVFNRYGECYAQFAYRIYDFLHTLSEAGEEHHTQRQSVIVAHAASLGLITETIETLSSVTHAEHTQTTMGLLFQTTRPLYENLISKKRHCDLERGRTIPFGTLSQPHITKLLALERDTAHALLTQTTGHIKS